MSLNPLPAIQRELPSWKAPPKKDVAPPPEIGRPAPVFAADRLPLASDRPNIVVFLRHCGCPFAEKTFKLLTKLSNTHSSDLRCIAVSQSSQADTDSWVPQVGGEWDVRIVVDQDRDLFAAWGLGVSNSWHVLSPWALSAVWSLGTKEGIWNRPTDSGNRWQMGGAFGVDKNGIVRWVEIPKTANEIPKFEEAVKVLLGDH